MWLLCQSAWHRSRLLYLATKLTVCIRQEKNVTLLQMNKSHICSMSKKNEKRLYLTVHRLTEPGCQLPHWAKVGEKCLLLPYSVKKNHPIWKHARRRLLGTLTALPVTGVGELGGKERGNTHTYTCTHTHASTKIQNTQYGTHSHGKPGNIRSFSGLEKSWRKGKSHWNG